MCMKTRKVRVNFASRSCLCLWDGLVSLSVGSSSGTAMVSMIRDKVE